MKSLLVGTLLLMGAAQNGGWGVDLRRADTVWLDLPQTAAWLERHRQAFDLRETRTGLPCPKGFLTKTPFVKLLSLHPTEKGLEWLWVIGEDTFLLQSRRVPIKQLCKHLVLLRGPCAKGPQTIEVMVVFRARAKDLSNEEEQWSWQPFLSEVWEKEIVAPLALPLRYSPTSVTSMSFLIYRSERYKGFILREVRLYGRKSAFLPRDEVIASYGRRQLPARFLLRLKELWQKHPPYGYVIRINDYYPASVGEGVLWVELIGGGRCVRPVELVEDDEGKRLRSTWETHLKGRQTPLLPLWELR